jgi:hypothetical protein
MRKLFSPNCSECIRQGLCVCNRGLKIRLETALVADASIISRSLESLNAGDKIIRILLKRRAISLEVTNVNVTEKVTGLCDPIE